MPDHVRLPASAAHVLVADLQYPGFDDADLHHVRRVLRLRDGEPVTVTDGRGSWRSCRLKGDALAVDGPIETTPRPAPALTIAFALVKGDRPEWVVQKLTELGIDRIIPVAAERGVVRWDAQRAARNVARLRQITRSAAMQSRRVWWPTVDDVAASNGLATLIPGIAAAHPGGQPPTLSLPAIAIGPEGGWSEAELALLGARLDLGPTTLRAETAAVAAGALLAALRAGLVAPAVGIIT